MGNKFKNSFGNVNPVMVIIILMMVANRFLRSGTSLGDWLMSSLLILPGIIIGLTVHEAAHGFASYWLGDPTPKNQGRLSLNPIRHIDPFGFIALFFAGFGWGKPVQINPMYYKHRRVDEMIVALAGVVMNFLVAFVASLGIKLMVNNFGFAAMYGDYSILFNLLYYIMYINIVLMIFNLIPVPPLDGFGIITQIFNLRKYNWYYTIYNNGFIILVVLIMFGVTSRILTPGVELITQLLL